MGEIHQYTRLQIQVVWVTRTSMRGTHQYPRLKNTDRRGGQDLFGSTHHCTRPQIQVGGVGRTTWGVLINILDCKYRYRKGDKFF